MSFKIYKKSDGVKIGHSTKSEGIGRQCVGKS